MKRYEYNYGKNPEGTLSTISGYATETTNFGETAFGILNKSTRDEENFTTPEVVSSSTATLFSVGNGTDNDSRKNIIELKADGTVYINGVGQYDGTNPGEATSIADEFQGIHDDITGLNEDVDRIDNTIESIHISEDNTNLIYTLLVDGQERGTINIPRDQFLKNVSYNEETNNLEFTFIVRGENNEEVEKQVNVNMTDLEDIYSAGDGLNLENKQFSVKVDADTQPYIEVSSNGVKIIGINEALDKKVSWDESKKVITLPADGSISALRNNGLEGGVLVCQRTYDEGATYVTEVGTTKNNLTLNSIERPKIDFAGGISENIAYESEVKSLQDRMSTAETDIDNLEGRMDTAESDIDTIQSDLSELIGDGEGSVQDQINDALQSYLPLSGGTMNGNIEFASSPDANGYEYVDLGLPSGNLWAKCNIGATNEEEAGLYFQWGDTQGYTAKQVGRGEGYKYFNYNDCKFNSGGSNTYSKYNNSDGKQFLDLEDDAAHVNMGGSWRMPTFADCKELFEYTNVEFLIGAPGRPIKKEESPSTESDDILYYDWEGGNIGMGNSWKYTGIRFSNKNNPDIYIIIPRAGYASEGRVSKSLLESFCLASSLCSESSVDYFGGRYDFCGVSNSARYYGYPIRGILPKSSNGIIISGKSDQDLLNAAGGTASISDITSQIDLTPYATKEEVGSNTYTDSNYLSKETNLTDAVLQLDEEIKATNDNLDLEHANAEATYAKKTELSNYLPLSGGTLIGGLYTRGMTNPDDNGEYYLGLTSVGFIITATSMKGTRVIDLGRNSASMGGLGYLDFYNSFGSINLRINPDGITLRDKTANDLLNGAGGTTSVSDITTQVQASIVDSAPETLDTLNELAAALGDDPNFATTVTNQIAQKASISGLPSNIVPAILPTPIYSDNYVRIAHQYCAKDDSSGTYGEAQSSFTQINAATSTTAGVLTAEDFKKLSNITLGENGGINGINFNAGISDSATFGIETEVDGDATTFVFRLTDNTPIQDKIQFRTTQWYNGGVNHYTPVQITDILQSRNPNTNEVERVANISELPSVVTTSADGLMSVADKSKLDSIAIQDGDIVASGFRINDGTANEVLTADGDSNTLKTINGQTLLGSGDITTPTPTVNAASGTKTIWTGTQSTYDSIDTKDANTLYFITEG